MGLVVVEREEDKAGMEFVTPTETPAAEAAPEDTG
jgi:hypothetical protein